MTLKKFWFLALLISSLMIVPVYGDAIWKSGIPSLYSTTKPIHVGDIVMIYISEASTAVQEAGTKTSKSSNLSSTFFDSWSQVAQVLGVSQLLKKQQQYKIGGGDDYTGAGQTSRKHKVEAVLTATVKEVFDNGTVRIGGEHQIKVNDENEVLTISGIIRIEDITSDNTIFSYQMANADVSVKGTGVVASKQTPGLLTQLFNWVF
ncbi:MAG: flagellar basal body L-ring protein FlgH [Candidatus Margulisiibacteriota bacterium]